MSRKKTKTTKTKATKTTSPEVQLPAPDQREWVARAEDLRVLVRVHATTEDEALPAAKEQFEDVATVEPGLADQDLEEQAPAPEEASFEVSDPEPIIVPNGLPPSSEPTPDLS